MPRVIRYSKKREAILSAICSTDCHPSAEWIYQTLKPSHPDLSLGTVYRNLAFLQEQGAIQSIGVVSGQERFDGTAIPHSHFICTEFGCVLDLHHPEPNDNLNQEVEREYGLCIDRHELTFYGRCTHCQKKTAGQTK